MFVTLLEEKKQKKILLSIVFIFLTFIILSSFIRLPQDNNFKTMYPSGMEKLNITINTKSNLHMMGVIIPFRNCFDELVEFIPYMDNYLNHKRTPHKFYVLNQVDNYRFNRASLANAGFLETQNECDYIAIHDVDLIPVNTDINYSYPLHGPFHVSAPKLHPKVTYRAFVGGIILFNKKQYKMINGMSNRYWGWGGEDDDLEIRIKRTGLRLHRPIGIKTGNKTFKDLHDGRKRVRDTIRYPDQGKKIHLFKNDTTGVNNVKYEVKSKVEIKIKGVPCIVINVNLTCDLKTTPWCLKPVDRWRVTKSKLFFNTTKTTTMKPSTITDTLQKPHNNSENNLKQFITNASSPRLQNFKRQRT